MRAPAIESATGLHPVGSKSPSLQVSPRLPPIQLSKKIEAKRSSPRARNLKLKFPAFQEQRTKNPKLSQRSNPQVPLSKNPNRSGIGSHPF
jgi:hypothetical protein